MPYEKKPIWVVPKDHKELKKKLRKDWHGEVSLSQLFRLTEYLYLNDKDFIKIIGRGLMLTGVLKVGPNPYYPFFQEKAAEEVSKQK